MLDLFQSFIKIPSPSGNERAFADVLIARLLAMGLTVTEDDAGSRFGGNTGNILAVLESSMNGSGASVHAEKGGASVSQNMRGGDEVAPSHEEIASSDIEGAGSKAACSENMTGGAAACHIPDSVMFTAHMDRVPGGDRINVRFQPDGRLTSDGQSILAADDVAGVCAILKGVERVILSGRPHGRVELLFTVSEEYELLGSRNLDTSKIQSKTAYCMDSSGRIGRVIIAAPAIDHINITIRGKSAHAGAEPEKGINAIKLAAKFLAGVRDGRLDHESTANYGIIRGGNATNIICDTVEITGEARSRDEKKLKEYEAYAEQFLKDTLSGTGASYDFTVDENHGAFAVDKDSTAVRRITEAMERIGVSPVAEAGGGGMDANILNEKGITTVGVATGYMKNHTFGEELFINDMHKAAELVETLICP